METFVDTYSEYFDIPRDPALQDPKRVLLGANMNDPDPRDYLQVSQVISGMFYGGQVHLNEIPLVATLALDLNQPCVGDLLAMKNTILANTTISQVDMDERVALRRKLYEKFLGCDLWYAYKDSEGNVTVDRLATAKNKSGNLLNAATADTATTFSGQLKALSHIGLFFKPDRNTIVKVNARAYSWYVDKTALVEGNWYVFPDPNQYGDIGTNKTADYPVVMECKTHYDIRNMSSGAAVNEPLLFMGDQSWRSYYSRQDDDFKARGNDSFDYAFTDKVSKDGVTAGDVFASDVFGNMFALFKDLGDDAFIADGFEDGEEIVIGDSRIPFTEKDKCRYLISGGLIDSPLPPERSVYSWESYPLDEIAEKDGIYYTTNTPVPMYSFWAGDCPEIEITSEPGE